MKAIVVLTFFLYLNRVLPVHILQFNFNSLRVTILILHCCIAKFHWGKEHILWAASILFLWGDEGIVSSLRFGDVVFKLITIFLLSNVHWRFVGFYSISFQIIFSIVALWAIISLLFVLEKLVSNSSSFLIRVVLSLFASVNAKSWYSSICFSSGLSYRITSCIE